MFYRLKNVLYGLKQALRVWNKRIDGLLKKIGFDKCVSKHDVYVMKDTSKWVIIPCIYIDDLLIMGNNEGYISEFKGDLMKELGMTDLDLVTYFLSQVQKGIAHASKEVYYWDIEEVRNEAL